MTKFEMIDWLDSLIGLNHTAEAAEMLRQMSWQPIGNAPKDGTVVLVYASQGYGEWNGMHAARWTDKEGCYGHNWRVAEYQNLGEEVSGRVTHWMPLPARPICTA